MKMFNNSAAQPSASQTRRPSPLAEPTGSSDRIPLSFAQQRLWFLEQLAPGTALYNIPLAVRMTGEVRVDYLEAALNAVIARHEVLRTNIVTENGTPAQLIRQPRPAQLRIIDHGGQDGEVPKNELPRLLTREAQRAFDLAEDLLIRCALFRIRAGVRVLLITLHHIVCDEWSLRILFREMAAFYGAFLEGQEPLLLDLPIQYADFAIWQGEYLQGSALAKELNYWKKTLNGAPPRLNLVPDLRPTDRSPHAGRRQYLELPRHLSDRLRELSRRDGVTLFMTLLAGFKALLFRYTRQDDILVGSPIAGRTRVETENLIGFFVNTLVLRTHLSGDPTFIELLQRVRETAFGAYQHQDLPFEKLVEELRPNRRSNDVPLVQAVFAHHHSIDAELQLPGVDLEWIDVDTETSKFDLTWVVRESGGGLNVCVEYASALFDDAAVTQLLGHWLTLLEGVASDPNRRVSRIPLLRPEERQRALVDWNQTSRPYPESASVPQLFEEQARQTPNAIAVRYGSSELSYSELDRRADHIAEALRGLGAGSNTVIGLCVDRSKDLVAGMLGILKTGAAYLPLDSSWPKERLSVMLEDAKAPVVLTQASLQAALPPTRASILCVDALPAASGGGSNMPVSPDDLAYVIYTSGSTGCPKGVAVPHRAIVSLVRKTDYAQLTEQDRVAQASNASFDAATFEIWGALLNGATLIGIEREVMLAPKELAARLSSERITTLFLTTALFNQVAAETPGAFRSLKHLLFGGEMVDPRWVKHVLEHQPPERLLHVYGPTETTTFAAWHHITALDSRRGSIPIGRPIANTRLYVLDGQLEPAPIGVPGEIYIGGPGVARGYLNDPELTAKKFVPDPFTDQRGARLFKTGDLARYLPDGAVEFIGRSDHQVKIRGFRVEPGEVEAVLRTHAAIRESLVVAEETESGRRLIAYVVLTEGFDSSSINDLRQFLKEKLPAYMVPAVLVPLPNLPLTANGKIDRAALPSPDQARPVLDEAFLAPRTRVEERLAALWSEILNVDRVGVQDSFFDLGGHSLLAVKLFAAIEKEFGKKLPLASLFERPTIEQLAQAIRANDLSAPWPLFVEIQPQGANPPFFWVHSLGGDGGGAFFYYRRLAQLLGPDQPSYGIRSPREPFTSLEEMADHYVDELLHFQPQGPYFLGGFCFGGIVAFEMAAQLRRRGREVGLLALLESARPGQNLAGIKWNATTVAALADNLRIWFADLASLSSVEFRARLHRKAKAFQQRLRQWIANSEKASDWADLGDLIDMEEYPKDYVRYARAHWQALTGYLPRSYPGRITLFRARKQPLLCADPTLGWGELAEEGVAVNVIPGAHEKMLDEPNVHILAAELKACLVEAQASGAEMPLVDAEQPDGEAERVDAGPRPCSIIT